MTNINEAVTDIQDIFEALQYPAEFLEKYVQMECLASSRGIETFLVRKKNDEQLYVAKCYDKDFCSFVYESDILKSLHHEDIPAFADEFQNDKTVCIVREYIAGEPLDQYLAQNSLMKKDMLGICVQLCDILIYLHGQKEPIIHRDIKPQNIIVKADGKISLIDFDISRIYHTESKTDTQFLGTREYAPPEQYGFAQTDCRTDIYSLGVVLGFMLTGGTDVKKTICKLGDDPLAGVYKKCTAFSPENRFASAEELKIALIYTDKHKKTVLNWMVFILSCFIFLCVGFSIGRYTDFMSSALKPSAGVTFEEPMIEQAVRLQVGKRENEIITDDELLLVTGLYVFGDTLVARTEQELHAEAERLLKSNLMREGTVNTLTDLRKMPNLKQIYISMQAITDISPLAALKNLEIVDLKNNPITDISALGELKFLKRVSLFDTRVTDLSPLSNCSMLCELNAGKLPFCSPAAFVGFDHLQNLNLYETTIDTLDGIENLTQLRSIEVKGVIDGDLTPLLSLPYLKDVILGEDMSFAAEAIADRAGFTISYQ